MDDEIDLRQYVRAVLKHKLWIALLVVLGALAGFGLRSRQPATYRATALVSVAQLPYTLRLEGVNQPANMVPFRSYPDLALSDSVVGLALERLRPMLPPEIDTVGELRTRLTAEAAEDPTLLRLSVSDLEAERAAAMANGWAEALTEHTASLYGPSATQLQAYEEQLAAAQADLEAAETALANFQAQNRVPLLEAELASQQFSLTDYLNRENRFSLLLEDAQDLLARLSQQDSAAPASAGDESTLLLLLTQASTGRTPLPTSGGAAGVIIPSLEVVISLSNQPSGQTVGQVAQSVTGLIETLQARRDEARAAAQALEPGILELQGQLAEARNQLVELERNRTTAESHYLALSSKVSEARIVAQDVAGTARVASLAVPPRRPTRPSLLLTVGLGAAAALALGVFLALVLEWWRAPAAAPRPLPVDGSGERLRA